MESFKIIDIGNTSQKPRKKLSKKQIYKEILSSSDKVQEIINNRKKTKRFDYLNMIPKIQNKTVKETPILDKTTNTKISNESKSDCNTSLDKSNLVSQELSKNLQQTNEEQVKKPRKQRVKRNKTPKNKLKDSKINEYFKPKQLETNQPTQSPSSNSRSYENKIVERAQQSIVDHLQYKIKKQVSPKTVILKKNKIVKKNNRNTSQNQIQLKSQPKQFTQNQIKEILKILIKLNSISQYNKIHKTIRRLNKIKVNQLLFALRLIKKFSNAPDNMLKNTLFNYITGDIKVQLQ